MSKTKRLGDIHKDVAFLEILRGARANFNEKIVAQSNSPASSRSVLVQETSHQICEFYFLLDALDIYKLENFSKLVNRHNDYLSSLLSEPEKMRRLGLKKERVLQSIFDGETQPRLIENWRAEPGTMDQSNLARFLVPVMSAETVRKLVVEFERSGFMTRTTSIYGSIMVRSTGVIEKLYGDYLREIRLNATQASL